ncbi:TetR/AcrR family transcriptional regulator [Xanthobacter sp. KR7-65]|uniref:TetR/AcrR family transcriptional regulator n=1 Tax=Xanthobacter sp. KR7-65 TaxID=3156612 RepID=UPI0032B31085
MTPPAKPHAARPPDPGGPAAAAPRRGRRDTAERIRSAARKLFLEKGYGATSMDAVAAAAPVSKRTLYQHFPGKAELFGAVIDEAWSHFTRAPLLSSEAPGDPRAVLHSYVQRLTDHWDRPDVIPLLRLVIAEAPRFPEMSQAYFAAGKEPAVMGLAAYFATLAADGRIDGARDPQLAAAQFLGAIKEPLFWPRVLGVPVAFDAEDAVARAIDAVLRRR